MVLKVRWCWMKWIDKSGGDVGWSGVERVVVLSEVDFKGVVILGGVVLIGWWSWMEL